MTCSKNHAGKICMHLAQFSYLAYDQNVETTVPQLCHGISDL